MVPLALAEDLHPPVALQLERLLLLSEPKPQHPPAAAQTISQAIARALSDSDLSDFADDDAAAAGGFGGDDDFDF